MERLFICGGNKYTISPTNTIALPVSVQDLPNQVEVNGVPLLLKSSFHISLVCIDELIRKNNILISNFRDSVLSDFCNFIKENKIELLNHSNEFRYAEKGDLKTVIVMSRVSNIDNFFAFLNEKYGLSLECPPTHITLYTFQGGLGIFLVDAEDIKNLTQLIENPVGRNL